MLLKMKRRLTTLSLKDKLNLIKEFKQNNDKKQLCDKFGCDISTVNRILRKENEIKNLAQGNTNLKRKRQRASAHEKLDKALTLWFNETLEQNVEITSQMILAKAKYYALMLNENFEPDANWLWRWRQRQNIKPAKTVPEKAKKQVNTEYITHTLPSVLKSYDGENIYNAYASGLFYNALPNINRAGQIDPLSGCGSENARISLIFLCNATGSYKKIYAIGKNKKPKCFTNKTLPVAYFSNAQAWVTTDIWNSILKSLDAQCVHECKKIVLFVDNAACYEAASVLENINLVLLPSHKTALIQPLAMGIIHDFKLRYRKLIAQKQLCHVEKGSTVNDFIKSFSMLDALNFVKRAWDLVEIATIVNCFKKTGFNIGEDANANAVLEMLHINADYINCDNNLECYSSLADANMQESVKCEVEYSDDSNDMDAAETNVNYTTPPTAKEALLAFEVLKNFCEHNNIEHYTESTIEEEISKVIIKNKCTNNST